MIRIRPLLAGMRNIDPLYKLQMNIKIAMLFLEDDDPVSAETFIKKASSLIAHSKVCVYLCVRGA